MKKLLYLFSFGFVLLMPFGVFASGGNYTTRMPFGSLSISDNGFLYMMLDSNWSATCDTVEYAFYAVNSSGVGPQLLNGFDSNPLFVISDLVLSYDLDYPTVPYFAGGIYCWKDSAYTTYTFQYDWYEQYTSGSIDDILLGISILIVLFSITLVAFIFNRIKKPWR